MVIKSCQILGGKSSNAMISASAVEMVHNFTLVHDDIMDNDEMRHGVPTVHKNLVCQLQFWQGMYYFQKHFKLFQNQNYHLIQLHI